VEEGLTACSSVNLFHDDNKEGTDGKGASEKKHEIEGKNKLNDTMLGFQNVILPSAEGCHPNITIGAQSKKLDRFNAVNPLMLSSQYCTMLLLMVMSIIWIHQASERNYQCTMLKMMMMEPATILLRLVERTYHISRMHLKTVSTMHLLMTIIKVKFICY